MAKKTSTSTKSPTTTPTAQTVVKAVPAEKIAAVAQPVEVVKTTPTKAIPTAPTKKLATHEQIAKRAFEISQSGHGGSEHDNWVRAERELRG